MTEIQGGERARERQPTMTAARARELARRALEDRLAQLLVETGGNVAEVARRLGKDRSTVRYHLRRFGMLGESAPPEGSRAARSTDRAGDRPPSDTGR